MRATVDRPGLDSQGRSPLIKIRRVRKGECPFCGYPVRAGGTHCEGCGREVIGDCATCGNERRVGTAHCAACGAVCAAWPQPRPV